MSLANKYRPTEFEDVVTQSVVTTVLNKQIANKSYSHSILFAGNAGCGKTTCARIFASKINGEVYELDCATHNGVADVKEIVENARVKSLIHNYKVFILDECHTLSSQAWSSLLITLEENLPTAIFIFCTTDTQKIPNTILSRVQRFNFIPITDSDMTDRIKLIAEKENLDINDEAIKHLVYSANGNMRQALTNIDKCLLYGDLTPENICKVLNIVSTNVMKDLYDAYEKKDTKTIITTIENLYNNGYELHEFIRQFLDYSIKLTNMKLVECILTLINEIRYDDSPKNIIIARLII